MPGAPNLLMRHHNRNSKSPATANCNRIQNGWCLALGVGVTLWGCSSIGDLPRLCDKVDCGESGDQAGAMAGGSGRAGEAQSAAAGAGGAETETDGSRVGAGGQVSRAAGGLPNAGGVVGNAGGSGGGVVGNAGGSGGGVVGNAGGSGGGVVGNAGGSGGGVVGNAGGGGGGAVGNAGGGVRNAGGGPGGSVLSAGGSVLGAGGANLLYTLAVDAPADQSRVSGKVTVSGKAPGYRNVEVWDATHSAPPLARTTPATDGAFSVSIDASALASGGTTWTIYAWDSAPGQSFQHSSKLTRSLTIDGPVVNGPASGDPAEPFVPSGYRLVFSDEFSATALDTAKWSTLAPWGVQWYSDSHQKQAFVPENVTLKDGLATFVAERSKGNTNGQPYASGSLTTKRTFTYGYFEARARVPAGKGFWPAFWLTSSSRWPPEWDIFEIVNGVIYGYTHPVAGGKCSFVEGAAGGDSTYTIPNVYGAFHVYGFRWTATDLYWYVDGVMTEHYVVDAAAGANDPFWLNISLQVGGDWPGDPDSSTVFPNQMDVDYVRVYQL